MNVEIWHYRRILESGNRLLRVMVSVQGRRECPRWVAMEGGGGLVEMVTKVMLGVWLQVVGGGEEEEQ